MSSNRLHQLLDGIFKNVIWIPALKPKWEKSLKTTESNFCWIKTPFSQFEPGRCGSVWLVSHHRAVPVLRPQVELFATPELCLTPLICAHSRDPQVSFYKPQTVRCFTRSLCGSLLCEDAPRRLCRKAPAAVYHRLYWERLMARSWWILPAGWFIDPVSSAKLWILKKLPVTSRNHLPTRSFLLRSCKWFSPCATGDFETIIDWIFVGVGLRNNNWTCEPCFCVERGHLRLSGALMHPSLRKRRAESSEWWRGRGRLTDGLSEWIIDSGLLTDAASIDSSKPAWWITADKQCWVSRCVF